MTHWQRRLGKWILRGLVLVFVLLLLDVAVLAYPNPIFAHKHSFREFTVYSSQPLPDDFDRVIGDVRLRIEAMEYPRPGARYRVYICGDRRRYAMLAFLSRRSANSSNTAETSPTSPRLENMTWLAA